MSRNGLPLAGQFGLLFSLILVTALSQAAEADVLKRMGEAVRTLNYEGVMVYARDGEMHSLRIVHRYQNGREQERLQALTGEAREVIRDNEVVTCILPEEEKVLIDRHELRGPLSTVASLSPESLTPHYTVNIEPAERLVDRNCKVLSLIPNDEYRYGYRVWVDDETQLPLRIDLLGTDGETLEQVMFTQVSFPETIEDQALQPAVDPAGYAWVRQNSEGSMVVKEPDPDWQISELPPGYKLISHELKLQGNGTKPVESFLFSDGMATVSAIIKPNEGRPSSLSGLSEMGALHAFSRQSDDYHLAVMGEVPAQTVRYIAERLHRKQVTTADKP